MSLTLPSQPFGTEDLPDLHLSSSPLVRTIVQVRFPPSTELLADPSKIFEIAKGLAADYPTFEAGNEVSFNITPSGVAPVPNSAPRWVLRSLSGHDVVAISPTSISLESTSYKNRESLLARLEQVLAFAIPVVRPAFIERLGVRYTNQVVDPDLVDKLDEYIRAEIMPARQIPLGGADILQTFSESLFDFGDQTALGVRSGTLPSGVTIDPAIPPTAGRSFILDLDSYSQERIVETGVDLLSARMSTLAEHAYRFFLWSLTPAGLDIFGGVEK